MTSAEEAKSACSRIIRIAENAKLGNELKAEKNEMENSLKEIEDFLGKEQKHSAEKKEKPKKLKRLGKVTRKKYLKETNIEEEIFKRYAGKRKKEGAKLVEADYTLYETHPYGKIANRIFKNASASIIRKYPAFSEPLFKAIRASGLKVLSETYLSMLFLSTMIAFGIISPIAMTAYRNPSIVLQILRGLMIGILGAGITAGIMYFYPSSVAKSRDSAIKQDLPFAIINMAAVAGSGAKPISIFKTLLSSKEYPGIRDEIKKIVNYVNLFGYDLSTALKAVARRTPSLRFKDLLDGIVNTIESGGDLKNYLQAMADEALTTYQLERKKSVESISTYSDIYTTVLIAAPLLFFVTLAIIQTMGGKIGGMEVSTLAFFGTFLAIPLLNVAFIIFMNAVQPK